MTAQSRFDRCVKKKIDREKRKEDESFHHLLQHSNEIISITFKVILLALHYPINWQPLISLSIRKSGTLATVKCSPSSHVYICM